MTIDSSAPRAQRSLRPLWLKIHRWAGLALAAFLVIAGVTGTFIAFHDRLDAWLNPQLFIASGEGEMRSPIELRERAEKLVPESTFDAMPLNLQAGKSLKFYLEARVNPATGEPYELDANELFLNPYTGEEVGRRNGGEIGLDREHLMETVFQLHRYLLLGDWGSRILMVVAIVWFLSSLIGFYLTFPVGGRRFFAGWKASWKVKWSAPLPRFSFDLHRASGLWMGLMLILISFTAMRVTMGDVGIFDRIISSIAPVYDATALIAPDAKPLEGEPRLAWEPALTLVRQLVAERAQVEGFSLLGESALHLDRGKGVYVYAVRSDMDAFKSGETELYVSATDGKELAVSHPGKATGNAISSWMGALHRARIDNGFYPWLVSATGLTTALLAITGFIVWLKRRPGARKTS